jgi:N-acetylglucosamine kinase-like BadF-type ATPase
MILIADSGGSKTDWRLLDGEKIEQYWSEGMNPYIVDRSNLEKTVEALSASIGNKEITEIFFYGAGCSTPDNNIKISESIQKYFANARISVNHDLLAVARALCSNERGIACILGTGANSCLYDGKEIVENIPSLGYILGDEGGGAHLGKSLMAHYFNKTLPADLSVQLERRYDMSRNTVLENVYQKKKPAQYLAGFSKFLFDNKAHPFVDSLIRESFKLFFERNVLKYKDAASVPIHFSGAIAFYFNSIIRQIANDYGLTIKNVVEGPIAGLALYHGGKMEDKLNS